MDHVVGRESSGDRPGVSAAIGNLPPRTAGADTRDRRVVHLDEGAPMHRINAGPSRSDADAFRTVMRDLAATVTIVTTRCGDEIHGMTVSAVCSVSLAPPLLLVCIAKGTRTHRLIAEGHIFAVHLLHQSQADLADRFAGRLISCGERFHELAYGHALTGAPVLLDCLAFLDCRVTAAHDGGDHTIFIGSVEGVGRGESGRPLTYLQGKYVPDFAHSLIISERGVNNGGPPAQQ